MADIAELSVLLRVNDQATGTLKNVSKSFNEAGQSALRMGRTMTLWGAGLTALGVLVVRSAMARDKTSEAGYAMDRFRDSVDDLTASLGQQLLPALTSIANSLADFLTAVSSFLEQHPLVARMVITIGALAAGLLVFGGTALIMVGMLQKVVVAFRFLSIALMTANPLLATLMLALAAGVFVWRNWDTIVERSRGILQDFLYGLGILTDASNTNNTSLERNRSFWERFGEQLRKQLGINDELVAQIRDNLLPWLGKMWDHFTKTWELNINAVGDFFTKTLPDWWEKAKAWLGTKWDITINAVGTFFTKTLPEWWISLTGWLGKTWNTNINAVGDFFTKTLPDWWNTLMAWLGGGVKMLVSVTGDFFTKILPDWWNTLMAWLGGGVKMLVSVTGDFFTKTLPTWWWELMRWVWSGINIAVNFVAGGFDAVKSFVNAIIDWLNYQLDKTILSRVNIPRMAHGGLVSGAAIVGEQGPELAVFPNNTRIIPNNQLGGASAGPTLIIHYNQNAPVYTLLDFEEEIAKIVRDAALSGGFRGILALE